MDNRESKSVDGLSQRVAGLEADFQNLTRTVERMADTVATLANTIQNRTKTDWNVLLALATVMITVLGGVGYLTITPVKEELLLARAHLRQHELLTAHPTQQARFQALRREVEKIQHEQLRRTEHVYNKNK